MAITLHTDVTDLPEQDELIAGRERDEFQRQVDGNVAELKNATATAGWPAHDSTKLFRRYVVAADDKAELKSVIRRAGTLHKVDPVFYKDATTEAGHAVVKFHVARKRVMVNGEPKMENGKPVYVKDDTLEANGKPKPKK